MKSEIFRDNGVSIITPSKKKVGGETPDFSNPNGFDKLTSLVPKPTHLLTYAIIALGVKSGERDASLQFKSLEGTSP